MCFLGLMSSDDLHSFNTTRWTRVLLAGRSGAVEGDSDGRAALADLCRDYWYPLYAFARRRGLEVPDAQDATQGFFLHLFEAGTLARASAEKGRFRSFLLGSMQHYLNKEHRHGQAAKRGGGALIFSLDEMAAEDRFSREPSDPATPEVLFERNWAFALIERVFHRLGEDYERAGRSRLFETLSPFLAGDKSRPGYEAIANELGMSPGAVGTAIFRMRRRYGELMRDEISHTVPTPQEVEEEIAHLMRVLARG